MNLSGRHSFQLYGALSILGLLGVLPASRAWAQIIPDTTLGVETTTVIQDTVVRGQEADLIDGGALRGSNLFHSFLEFNVGETQRLYFANPTGVENILSRVTGFNGSDIMGTLGVDGSANLFLLNPNGIVFGPNAQLDISGSFLASTADSFVFADGSQFSAATPQAPELLSVNVPLGVQWGPSQTGPLTNTANLVVPNGQSLTLVGGEVTHTGSLKAPGGTVEVLGERVALVDTASIDVSSPTGGGTVRVGGDYQGQGTTPRALTTLVGPEVTIIADAIESGGGGTVIIWSDEATHFYGMVLARGGSLEGDGGFVEVSSPRVLIFDGQVDTTAPNGNIGLLLIDPENIRIVAESPLDDPVETRILASTINAATTDVILQATNNIIFDAPISMVNPGFGLTARADGNIEVNADIGTNGGTINLIASNINLTDANIGFEAQGGRTPGEVELRANPGIIRLINSTIATNTDNIEAAPDAILDAAEGIWLLNGSRVTASTNGTGDGGTVFLRSPQGAIRIEGKPRDENSISDGDFISTVSSFSGASVSPTTQSGGIDIVADQLFVLNLGRLSTGTNGVGTGGSINVRAREVVVQGEISASTFASGDGGSVIITNADLVRVDGAFVGAQSLPQASGNAGQVFVQTNQLLVENRGRISAEARGPGSAGDVTINAAEDIEIRTTGVGEPFSRITVSSEAGRAGSLSVNANSIWLSNGRIEARTEALDDESGNIDIHLSGTLLRLENGSQITTAAAAGSRGGNIIIKIPNGFLLAQPNSNNDILANANLGPGGNIFVTAEAIFGIEERNPPTDFTSDFNASSEADIQGEITLLTLGIDPSRGLAEFPITVVDVSGLVATGCVGDNRAGVEDQGEFSVTGRGGLSPRLTEALAPAGSPPTLATLDDETLDDRPTPLPPLDTTLIEPLEEAQGLVEDANGRVTIAAKGMATPVSPATAAALNCNAL